MTSSIGDTVGVEMSAIQLAKRVLRKRLTKEFKTIPAESIETQCT
jgi:hypothetical protein